MKNNPFPLNPFPPGHEPQAPPEYYEEDDTED
jgi:hypothetical protein